MPSVQTLVLEQRSNFGCKDCGIVAYFIQKERAFTANSNADFLCNMAPVKAPFSWPKSSLPANPAEWRAIQRLQTNVRSAS